MEKKQLTFRIDTNIVKQLKFLAVEKDRSLTDLLLEALKDLFEKYKKESE